MRNWAWHATFGRLGANRRYMLSALLCSVLGACFPQVGVPDWRYEQAERLVDEGTMALREGRLSDAEDAFELAREHAPLAAALDGQGCVALLRGDLAQAELLFRRAYESDATYDEALGNLALVLDVVGRKEEALDLYRAMLEQHPEAGQHRSNRAALAFDVGENRRGVEAELAKAVLLLGSGVAEINLKRIREGRRSGYGEESN